MMDNPGIFSLSSAVTAAGTIVTSRATDITALDGILGATISMQFIAGTGGTTCKAYLRQTFDSGATYQDIACAAFAITNAIKQFNVSGLTPHLSPVTPTDGTLADDTAVDGILGGDLDLKVISTGTYVGAQVIVRVVAR
jgi:hypothetical protein